MKKVILVISLFVLSCQNKQQVNLINYLTDSLFNLDAASIVSLEENNEISIELKKPYKYVHAPQIENFDYFNSQLDFLSFYLISKIPDDNYENLAFNYYLKDGSGNYSKEFSSVDIHNIKEYFKDEKFNKMFNYILVRLDSQDFYGLEYSILLVNKDFHDNNFNKDFFGLLKSFNDECKYQNDLKAKLTFLMTYGAYKNDEREQFKNVSNHIKELWYICKGEDIEIAMKKIE